MALVTDGRIKLFNHITINPGRSEKGYGGTFNFNAPPTIIYAVKNSETFTEIRKKDFKQKLAELLSEQSSIVERINNGELKFEGMEKIINEYNDTHKIQARQITAKVVDSETKKPIKNAKVTIQGTNIETITNFLGFIQITIDVLDTLVIEHPEYENGRIKVPEVNSFQIILTRTSAKKG